MTRAQSRLRREQTRRLHRQNFRVVILRVFGLPQGFGASPHPKRDVIPEDLIRAIQRPKNRQRSGVFAEVHRTNRALQPAIARLPGVKRALIQFLENGHCLGKILAGDQFFNAQNRLGAVPIVQTPDHRNHGEKRQREQRDTPPRENPSIFETRHRTPLFGDSHMAGVGWATAT